MTDAPATQTMIFSKLWLFYNNNKEFIMALAKLYYKNLTRHYIFIIAKLRSIIINPHKMWDMHVWYTSRQDPPTFFYLFFLENLTNLTHPLWSICCEQYRERIVINELVNSRPPFPQWAFTKGVTQSMMQFSSFTLLCWKMTFVQ